MKATELMIGDRVFIAGSPTRTIKQLTKHKVGYIANDYDTRVYYTRTEFVFGVPLTAEILEKNGWKEYPQVYSRQKLRFDICRFEDEVGITLQGNCIVLKYVHQLQHALRLCGLNDLADNFKV